MSILIAYATNHGQTGRIAMRIAGALADAGLDAELEELPKHGDGPDPAGHEAVVVGASIHAGHHQHQVVRWLRHHAGALSTRPTALFSVSLTAAEDSDEARATARGLVDQLLADTDFAPARVELVAGALQYREYDFFTRLLMRRIAKHEGQSTDTSADVDFTDWARVDAFAREIAEVLETADVSHT